MSDAPQHPPKMTKERLLEHAEATVKDRGVPYGGVEDNFNRIAVLWGAYMDASEMHSRMVTPADVAIMMILMKTGRLAGNPSHMDSITDIAGYAACLGEIAGRDQ